MPSLPSSGPFRGGVVAAVATVAAWALFQLLGLPSPVLFGALLGGMAGALTVSSPPTLPPPTFTAGQALVGATIGGLVSPQTLRGAFADWAPILAVTLGTLVLSVLAGQVLRVHRDVSATTGAFAMVAGGASGMTALAHELGADDRVVTVVQYLRVLLVLLAMPLVTATVFHPAAQQHGAAPSSASSPALGLLFTVVAVAVGLPLARVAHVPAGSLLGPLLVAVVLAVAGVFGTGGVPVPVQDLAYLLIGLQVGLRFTRDSLRSIARLLPLALGLILALIAACAGMGWVLSHAVGVAPLDAYLATTPGGLYAVLATAVDSGSDVTFVLATQVVRLLVMLLAAPVLAHVLRRRRPRPRRR
ncbi:MAG TPA: AbrB family transcriptional regulator [Segeticoccus sp.]|uniref:AbrB family transcriptional regulator n=1 Tax=Segeticoccus sp. TaxID=2706531 RepID=UPI002D80E50E|nr:AbrB family transcriptional regulator [Segeticoccus sp.]HET8598925.1 AbrB family transcriptional regulator [Segeticoccus sp.]